MQLRDIPNRLKWRLFPHRSERNFLLDLILEVVADQVLDAAMRRDAEEADRAAQQEAWEHWIGYGADADVVEAELVT
jgi:hypothetical protein